jgi:hypothetical protein
MKCYTLTVIVNDKPFLSVGATETTLPDAHRSMMMQAVRSFPEHDTRISIADDNSDIPAWMQGHPVELD